MHARIAAKAATRDEAWRLVRPLEEKVRRILGASIWGEDGDTLAGTAGRKLRDAGLTLAVMESATGGAIGDAITDSEGASEYFRGSLVSYAAQTKIELGVPAEVIAAHGVISQQTAEAMAKAARERLGADIGMGVTGIVGTEEARASRRGRCTSPSTTASTSSTRTRSTTRGGRRRSAARCCRRCRCCAVT